MLKNTMRVILSRTFAFAILALLQIVIFFWLVLWFANGGAVAYSIITIVTVVILVTILEKDELNPAYKLMWLVIIVVLPTTGAVFYLIWGHRNVPRRKRRQFLEIEKRADSALTQDERVMQALREHDPLHYNSANYLLRQAYSPVYAGTEVEYYPLGEDFFPHFLKEIEKAEKFIFMEYYIYQEGYMLDTTVEVLKRKAAEGVDVRILIDGFGSLFTLPPDYGKMLKSHGIKVRYFAPMEVTWHITDYAMLNHRDHRKLTVVDGVVGFSGGLNFADEYINRKRRFGEWKDTTFRLEGPGVYPLTVTFLRTWDVCSNTESDYESYRPALPPLPTEAIDAEKGFVQPYCDTPLDGENVSENAYLNVIHCAKEYVYICTPYLILDNEMITSLSLAAKSGVDVRILTPGIPDKRAVFLVTQSYYPALLRAGVRIFEFTPGFNHGKMYVSDDRIAIVGSANMDYRSLYLHFENCVSFYDGKIVDEVRDDMRACFARSREVTLEHTRSTHPVRRLLQVAARFFAPML